MPSLLLLGNRSSIILIRPTLSKHMTTEVVSLVCFLEFVTAAGFLRNLEKRNKLILGIPKMN